MEPPLPAVGLAPPQGPPQPAPLWDAVQWASHGDALHVPRNEFPAFTTYLEAWGLRQEQILRHALDRIAARPPSGAPSGQGEFRCAPRAAWESLIENTDMDAHDDSGKAVRPDFSLRDDGEVCDPGVVRFVRINSNHSRHADTEEVMQTKLPGNRMMESSSTDKREKWKQCKSLSSAALPKSRWEFFTPRPYEEWSRLRKLVAKVVESYAFNVVCGVMILGNAITMAYMTDMAVVEASGGDRKQIGLIADMEIVFIFFYAAELLLRVFVYQTGFFICADWSWNTLDLFLVFLAVYDLVAVSTGFMGGGTNFSFMRLLKVLKVLKTLRTVRVLRMFRELRLMIHSVFGSIRSLFWAIIMISLVTYIFGCCFTQAMALSLDELPESETAEKEQILFYWGSVLRSMNTLYWCSTGGENWRFPAMHLLNFSLPIYCLFLVYISFFLFVVVNTLTSIIIEATMHSASKERSEVINEELKRKHYYIKSFEALYRRLEEGSGGVTIDQLEKHLADEEMQAFMQSLDIDASDINQFFASLSSDTSGSIDLDTFVVGCMKLKGSARSMDLMCLYHSHMNLVRSSKLFEERTLKQLMKLEASTDAVMRALGVREAVVGMGGANKGPATPGL